MRTHEWTEQEEEYLRLNHRDLTLMDLSTLLHLAPSTISKKIIQMGLREAHACRRNSLEWSEESLSYLREHFAMTSSGDIADHLGISDTSVRNKARELGLEKSPEWNKQAYHNRYVSRYSGRRL